MANQALYDAAQRCVEEEAEALNSLSQSIWSNPELNYQERHAHRVLCDFLEQRGFDVERSFTGLETAFKASWNNFDGSDKKSPHIVVISEYDALPEIGHACGHNLIAESGVAAGLAVKAALKESGQLSGKITVLGTPAEEGGGGKLQLIDRGVFGDVDIALMVHPASFNASAPTCLAIRNFAVTYRGHAVHASIAPWEGVNALDAVVLAYNGISSLRQQSKPSNRLHAIISKGGVKPNIIPDHTEMQIYMRALNMEDLEVLVEKAISCLKGAAVSTGCEIEIEGGTNYYNLVSNIPLVELYEKHMHAIDPESVIERDQSFNGSTDMGNVSHVVPSIHPFYSIGTALNHTKEFTKIAGAPGAQRPTLVQAKALALTALDAMSDQCLMEVIKEGFNNSPTIRDPATSNKTL